MLSDPPAGWGGRTGRIDKALMEKLQGDRPSDQVLVCVCGPPAMYASLCGAKDQDEDLGALGELGFSASMIYKF